MRRALRFFLIAFSIEPLPVQGAEWRIARPGWQYEFPRDHGAHPEFKTEWWYFTGNVAAADGREFGYQLTIFRQGVRPPGAEPIAQSRFVTSDFKFAHFAIADLLAGKFHHWQKVSRGAFGEAGTAATERVAWLEDWTVELQPDGGFRVRAAMNDAAIEFRTVPAKPLVLQGLDGISRKAVGEGHASHYYSYSRLATNGRLRVDGKDFQVSGESWFDHEWATNQLTPEQAGWNWFALQFDDGTELMLYQMRRRDGGIDPISSGTAVDGAGAGTHLTSGDYKLEPKDSWKSKATGAEYPIRWGLEVPGLGLVAEITTPLPQQELALGAIAYWEGAIRIEGRKHGQPVKGRGYMELTGYAGPLGILSAQP